jgi:HK97 family phage prohead protease
MLEYKVVPFELRELKAAAAGDGWEIAGYASVFGGSPDFYGDVVAPGAFTESIAAYPPKFLFEHSEPIGKTIAIHEDEHGLYGRWSIVDTRAGIDAHKLAKAGVLDSLSIGFFPEVWEYRDDGVRLLLKVTLLEVSAVAIPAQPRAQITNVKASRSPAPIDEQCEDVRVAVRELVERVCSGSDQKRDEGKAPLSEARRYLIADLSGSLTVAAGQLAALLDPADEPEPEHRTAPLDDLDFAALRARLERLGVAVGEPP